MKRFYPLIICTLMFFTSVFHANPARADMFGGDVAVLLQILQNALQQLIILRQTLDVAKNDSDLLHSVNRDIETALTEIHAIQDVVRETNDIGKTRDPVELLNRVRNIYGRLPRLGNLERMNFADKATGNGLAVDNDTHLHAAQMDQIGLRLQEQARTASPGRAQQITAQSQSAMLHSLAQIERTDATILRVDSTQLALQNQKEKNHIESFDHSYSALSASKASQESDLTLGSL